MGYYVHIHVAFACDENEPVAALAAKHRPSIAEGDDGARAAQWFLDDLAKRTGKNHGTKGGLSLWGMIGNYTVVESFVSVLRPFWREMLTSEAGGICNFEHILVFGEREQTEKTTAYEIFLADEEDPNSDLIVKEHECPFTFMQM
jgi:hypothetical protein